jgi:hypothetical protein
MSEDNVTCVFEAGDGALWFGTGHGLTRYQDGRFRVFTSRDGLLNDTITGIGEHSKLGLLVATFARKLNIIREDRVSVFEPLSIASTVPSTIHEDRNGVLWIGTLGAGLYRIRNAQVDHFPFANSQGRHVFWGVHESSDGTLWFATPNGLLRHQDGSFESVRVYDLGANLGVTHGIHEDREGRLWIATRDQGICRLQDGQSRRCFTKADGLFDNTVLGLAEDEVGGLWMSSPRGISRVDRADLDALDRGEIRRLRSRSFGVADGMKTAECQGARWPAIWRATDGRIWFPTSKGAVVADPGQLTDGRSPSPPIGIERIIVDGRSYRIGEALRAPPGRGDIEIAFAGLSYRTPELVRFRYRLEGFDREWAEVLGRRRVNYTNVTHGTYRFSVTASTDGESWTSPPARIKLTLEPHFYQTGWWYAFLGVMALAALWGAYRWRVHQLRKRAEELSVKIREALADVKVLSGLLPICASCKKIRSDKGYWEQIEAYIDEHSEATFSHGICPECVRKLYPELADKALSQLRSDT